MRLGGPALGLSRSLATKVVPKVLDLTARSVLVWI